MIGEKRKEKICCVAYYTDASLKSESRRENMSVMPIVDYLHEKIQAQGFGMRVIAPTETVDGHKYYKSRNECLKNGIELYSCATKGHKSRVGKAINRIVISISLTWNMIKNTHTGDKVFVYHDPSNVAALLLAKRIRKLKYILYFGEVYQHVYPDTCKRVKKYEWKLIRNSDAYILSTEELKRYTGDKPYIVLNGIYKPERSYPKLEFARDGRINLLYGGKISKTMGAFKAAELAKYLDRHYCIRIIGTGDKREEDELKEIIKDVNENGHGAEVIFDGKKIGDEYKRYVQSCQIGLSIREIEGKFNKSSFPSKICSYLCNGLAVVSTPIPTVVSSQLSEDISFSEDMSVESIVKAVEDSFLKFDGERIRKKIQALDTTFSDELMKLLEKMPC